MAPRTLPGVGSVASKEKALFSRSWESNKVFAEPYLTKFVWVPAQQKQSYLKAKALSKADAEARRHSAPCVYSK